METNTTFESIRRFFVEPILSIGSGSFSLWGILMFILSIALLFWVSGLIILFSRPIKVGDRVEVGNTIGDVVDMSARATTINTNDNITIIVPKSEFIGNTMINRSHNDRNIRFRIPVGVACKENPDHIKKLLPEVAGEHPGILKAHPPDVIFDEYGVSSLNFYLLVWTTKYINRPSFLKSDLYFSIFRKLKENNVEIPFPHRDIHC